MRRVALAAALSLVLGTGVDAQDAADVAQECAPPAGWREVAERAEDRILVVGDFHGTAELPAAFASYVCAASGLGGRTLVGLEIDERYASLLAEARASAAPRDALLLGMADHWTSQDGRGSEAMLDMTVRLLGMEGVDIVPFFSSVTMRDGQKAHEEAMALSIAEAADRGYDRVIVFVGNFHAAKTPVSDYDSMAMHLPEGTLALDVRYDDGEAWNWMSDGPGVHAIRGGRSGVPAGASAPAIGWSEALEPRFDGYLYVGAITASPPAGGVAGSD